MKSCGPRLRSIRDAVLTLLLLPAFLYGQQPSGQVTAVEGQAQLSRLILTVPLSLKVGEDVLIRDIIDTREQSLARILFGGKATVTVRELSHFEVREETLPGGNTRSIIDLNFGAILVNVARKLMRPGDEVQIRTSNAGAVVRGSTLFVEARDSFTQLSGSSTLSCRPPLSCASILLTDNHFAQVTGTGPHRGFTAPTLIPPGRAAEILQSMQTGRAFTAEVNAAQIIQGAVDEIAVLENATSEPVTETIGCSRTEVGDTILPRCPRIFTLRPVVCCPPPPLCCLPPDPPGVDKLPVDRLPVDKIPVDRPVVTGLD